MFIRTKTHEAVVADLKAEIDILEQGNRSLIKASRQFKQERDDARTALAAAHVELAALKKGREKRIANLTAANERRRQRAANAA